MLNLNLYYLLLSSKFTYNFKNYFQFFQQAHNKNLPMHREKIWGKIELFTILFFFIHAYWNL